MKIKDLFDSKIQGCYLAAEVGTNHNGSLDTALDMVERFAGLGAQGIKFQYLRADRLYPAETLAADYLVEQGVAPKKARINDILSRVELGPAQIEELISACRENGVEFLCSVFDLDSLEELVGLGLESIKIASTEITHYPLLEEAGRTGLPLILSTGMARLGEIETALEKIGHDRIVLLHCTAAYPTPAEEVNLRAMVSLGRTFGLPVGYSDHTLGSLAGSCAVSLGARMVEKHVTLDKSQSGPDHHFAASPQEFQHLAQALNQARTMLGSKRKKPTVSEADLIGYRPGLFAARPLKEGLVLTKDDLKIMRRNRTGIGVEHLELVLGRKTSASLESGQALEWSLI